MTSSSISIGLPALEPGEFQQESGGDTQKIAIPASGLLARMHHRGLSRTGRMALRRPIIYLAAEILSILASFTVCTACTVELSDPESEIYPQEALIIPRNGQPVLDDLPVEQCQPGAVQWVSDRIVRSADPLPEPAPRAAFTDPIYGTCIIRISDRNSDLSPDDPSTGLKNEYSRVQSFNADGTLLLLRSIESNWYLYNAETLRPLAQLPLGVEPRWDASESHQLYSLDGTWLLVLDLDTGVQIIKHDFALDFPDTDLAAVWTRYEGSPSFDGSSWGLLAQDADWNSVALLVYDLPSDRVQAVSELPAGGEIDSVTISPLGSYLLVYHDEICEPGQTVDAQHPCGLMVYDRDLKRARNLLPVIGHSDTALDAGGREVLVFQDIQKDEISILDLETGAITPLLAIDFSYSPLGFHFSGRGVGRPGWVLVSTYDGTRPPMTWMDDVVFALELTPGGRVIRLAVTHSVVDSMKEHDYWAEPHASVNADFTRVLLTSNWGRSGTGEVDTYMIALPQNWLDTLE